MDRPPHPDPRTATADAAGAGAPGSYPIGRAAITVLVAAILAACQALLPDATDATQIGWHTFDDARTAVEAIEPFVTHKSAVVASGFDPRVNPAVTILTYPEIVQRFAAGSALRPEEYERGIRACLAAGKSCTGYAVAARRVRRDRVGNFWLDSLAFRRELDVSGWTFNALILFVDDVAVYRTYGGQPNLRERQVTRNPLGPLQGWGDALRLR